MNGRLRNETNYWSNEDKNGNTRVSLTPSSFPQLIASVPITYKESTDMKSLLHVEKMNMVNIKRWKNRVIVDHCWYISESPHDWKIPLLGVLSRLRIMENEHDEIQFRNNHVSTVHLQWNQDDDRERSIDSIDSAFTCEIEIKLPFLATNILLSSGLLVIGTSMGAIVYDLLDLTRFHSTRNDEKVEVWFDQLKNFRFLKSYSIDTMDMNSIYFTAVSGDRLGVWKVESLKTAFMNEASSCEEALWATKVHVRGRATSVKISDSIIVLSSWDGSASVYKRVSTSEWSRIGNNNSSGTADCCWERPSLQSEHEYAPTIVVLCCDTFVVSTPNSTHIRIYDIHSNLLIKTVQFDSGKEVQGMVSFPFTDNQQKDQYLVVAVNDLDKMVVFTANFKK